MSTLNLRIFRRTSDSIALLFNKLALTDAQLAAMKIAATDEAGDSKIVSYTLSDDEKSNTG